MIPLKLIILSVLFVSFSYRSSLANFDAGVAAYQSGNELLAFKEFSESAKEGHADSQFNLALMYELGIGVSKDEREAVVWYQRAAKQGNSNAQYNLAVLYENGRGCDVNFAGAHQWYRKAAEQRDALAIGNLGMLYLRGQGVAEDKVAGLALLLLSATMDSSPENHARQNVMLTRGLTPEAITAAQNLYLELGKDENLLVPLDRYLEAQKSGNKILE